MPDLTTDAQLEYVEGQFRAGFPALLAHFQRLSEQASRGHGVRLDVPYGAHPRQVFDVFWANEPQGILLYLHAGYWQSRDKSLFRFLGPAWSAWGFHVVLANYPLCPEVSLAGLVQSVKPLVAGVRRFIGVTHQVGLPLAVVGHSAGAHLAVELALTAERVTETETKAPRHRRHSLEIASSVQGVWGISGVYDPEPLLQTSLNEKLKLDRLSAQQACVTRRVQPGLPPALWMVGATETRAFWGQNTSMHAAWLEKNNVSQLWVVPGADHFTVLEACTEKSGPNRAAFDAWWEAVARAARSQRNRH